ncbi:DUF3099 domain-containing protein [Amnibacterium endophyticum]|uniref:DUF3099 domain-containing protein n=1 Tax=Amnibacterium endophyticum TaxID=2109337 RepID=A0ABW4LD61_9MICO
MTRNAVQSATALHLSPAEDRKKRMRAYTTAMSIRTACFVLVFFVPGWWKLVFGIGAVVLPYIAVILANAGSAAGTSPISPGLQQGRLALEERAQPSWSSPSDGTGWTSQDDARAWSTTEPEAAPGAAQPQWQRQE